MAFSGVRLNMLTIWNLFGYYVLRHLFKPDTEMLLLWMAQRNQLENDRRRSIESEAELAWERSRMRSARNQRWYLEELLLEKERESRAPPLYPDISEHTKAIYLSILYDLYQQKLISTRAYINKIESLQKISGRYSYMLNVE